MSRTRAETVVRFPPGAISAGLLLAVAVVLGQVNRFSGPFVFDDVPAVAAAARLLEGVSAADSPSNDPGETTAGRPLLLLSFVLNRAISGDAVWSYHALNVAIHTVAALLLFGLVRRLLLELVPARPPGESTVWAALLSGWWALHPLQTAAVTYVVQRAESLAGLFVLLALYSFLRSLKSTTPRRWQSLTVVACILGVATKETGVVAPVLILLLDRACSACSFAGALRARWGFYAATTVSWVVLATLLLLSGGRGGTAGFDTAVSPWHYLLTQTHALFIYLRLTVWPSPLVFDYGTLRVTEIAAALVPGLALLAVGFASFIALWRGSRFGILGAAFFVLLAPSSSFVPIASQTVAEHRMYLALSVPLAFAVYLARRYLGRLALPVLAAGVVGAGVTSLARNADYRTDLALWRDTAAKRPENARAHHNLGLAELARGRPADALPHLETARRLGPGVADVHHNVAVTLARLGRPAEALASAQQAFAVDPRHGASLRLAASVALSLNLPTEAVELARRALAVSPGSAPAHHTLAEALLRTRAAVESLQNSQEAIRLQPSFAAAHLSAGNACVELQRLPEARRHYESARSLAPDDARVHNNLGNLQARQGDFATAVPHFERALAIDPSLVDARRNLALALLQMDRLAAAEPHLALLSAALPRDTAIADALRRVRAELKGVRR